MTSYNFLWRGPFMRLPHLFSQPLPAPTISGLPNPDHWCQITDFAYHYHCYPLNLSRTLFSSGQPLTTLLRSSPSRPPSHYIFIFTGQSPQCRVINRAGWRHVGRLIIRCLFKLVSLNIYSMFIHWRGWILLGTRVGEEQKRKQVVWDLHTPV